MTFGDESSPTKTKSARCHHNAIIYATSFSTFANGLSISQEPTSRSSCLLLMVDLHGKAYGSNYRRLAEIKRLYDLDNLFRMNQNIRPSDQTACVGRRHSRRRRWD